jgi:hypothetical protein
VRAKVEQRSHQHGSRWGICDHGSNSWVTRGRRQTSRRGQAFFRPIIELGRVAVFVRRAAGRSVRPLDRRVSAAATGEDDRARHGFEREPDLGEQEGSAYN